MRGVFGFGRMRACQELFSRQDATAQSGMLSGEFEPASP